MSAFVFVRPLSVSVSPFGINELGVNKRFQPEHATKTCPFCPGVLEDEIHFLFICPVYAGV